MKKILLSSLFMSVISMTAFAGAMEGDQTNEFHLLGVNFPGGDRRLSVRLNIRAHATVEDFIAYLRNTSAPNGRPYVEGEISRMVMNRRVNLHLSIPIENLAIDNNDTFLIEYRYLVQPEARHEAPGLPPQDSDWIGNVAGGRYG